MTHVQDLNNRSTFLIKNTVPAIDEFTNLPRFILMKNSPRQRETP